MPDIHAENGYIVVQRELGEGVSEVEMQFPMHPRPHSVVIGLALAYLALARRGIPYVASSPTLLAYAVRTADLDAATHTAFHQAIELVQREATRLFADAEIYLLGAHDKGVLDTDPDGALASYRQADVIGKRFLERFAPGA